MMGARMSEIKKTKEMEFLGKRLKKIRTINEYTMEQTAEKLRRGNKSSISRAESGKMSRNHLIEIAKEYAELFGLSKIQLNQLLRGDKIVIPDTSALLRNPQLIDELNEEYVKVIIPNIVVGELNAIKDRKKKGNLSTKAWEIIRGISCGEYVSCRDYSGEEGITNDCKIIKVAEEVCEEYSSNVEIITEDTDYSAYLKGHSTITVISLKEYRNLMTK